MALAVETQPGDLLGKYRILERIGGGGMAEVFRGRHEKLDRDVAIKVLRSSLASDPGFIARFEREARLVANLRHSNIVQVFDFDTHGDRLYMVMEYVKGGTLKQFLETKNEIREKIPLREILRLLSQIAGALDYAHEQGMLHRDLKPSNILLDLDGNTYLSDFGIARIIGQSEITRTGSILGTPAYMSPEQCEGSTLTPASDIYSLGIILFEMITGCVPFDAESPLAVLHRQIHDPLPMLALYRRGLPSEMDTFLQKALAKKPGDRFPNARALLKAFEQFVPSNRVDISEPGIETEIPIKALPVHLDQDEKKKGFFSGGWLPALAILIFVLMVVAVMIWSARQSNLATIKRCSSAKTCEAAAIQLIGANRPVMAVEAYAKASSLVTPSEQIEWAQLKCDQADLLAKLNKIPDARTAYRDCAAWTQNETSLQTIRTFAQQKLKELR